MTETIEKLVEATAKLDSDIETVRQQIRTSNEADPQQESHELNLRIEQLRLQNSALHLERRAKEVVYDYLSGHITQPRKQLRVLSGEEIAKERDLSKVLEELSEKKPRGKHWTGIYAVTATIPKFIEK